MIFFAGRAESVAILFRGFFLQDIAMELLHLILILFCVFIGVSSQNPNLENQDLSPEEIFKARHLLVHHPLLRWHFDHSCRLTDYLRYKWSLRRQLTINDNVYYLEKKLGRGQYGVVYLARLQENPCEKVAIKMLTYRGDEKDEDIETRFSKEVENSRRVGRLLDVDDERFILVQKFIDGIPFSRLIRYHGFSESEQCLVARYYKREIMRFHRQFGLVHRDLNTRNEIVTRDGSIELIDFGKSEIARGSLPRRELRLIPERLDHFSIN